MKAIIIAMSLITGYVIDSETKEPITGAKVEVLGTENVTYTDFDGIYNVECLNDTTKIKLSFISYKDTVVTVKDLREGEVELTSY